MDAELRRAAIVESAWNELLDPEERRSHQARLLRAERRAIRAADVWRQCHTDEELAARLRELARSFRADAESPLNIRVEPLSPAELDALETRLAESIVALRAKAPAFEAGTNEIDAATREMDALFHVVAYSNLRRRRERKAEALGVLDRQLREMEEDWPGIATVASSYAD